VRTRPFESAFDMTPFRFFVHYGLVMMACMMFFLTTLAPIKTSSLFTVEFQLRIITILLISIALRLGAKES